MSLFLLLLTAAQADEIYIRNKPFEGEVQGSGSQTAVEARPLAQALGLSVTESETQLILGEAPESPVEGQVLINGEAVEASPLEGGKWLVPLEKAVELAGGRVIVNRDLGTVDVYLTDKKKSALNTGVAPSARHGGGENLSPKSDPEIEEYGYQTRGGQWVIPVQFKSAKKFSEGLAAVQEAVGARRKEKRDVVRGSGSGPVIVMRKVGTRDVFVRKGGKWGFINGAGVYVIKPQYTRVESFKKGAARVWRGKSSFWIDKEGNRLKRPPPI